MCWWAFVRGSETPVRADYGYIPEEENVLVGTCTRSYQRRGDVLVGACPTQRRGRVGGRLSAGVRHMLAEVVDISQRRGMWGGSRPY